MSAKGKKRNSKASKDENEMKFKCEYCKALFETFEAGELHHNNSRHKKKDIKIINMMEDIEKVAKNIEDFEEDQDDDDTDPHFKNAPAKRKSVSRKNAKKIKVEPVKKKKEEHSDNSASMEDEEEDEEEDIKGDGDIKKGRKPKYGKPATTSTSKESQLFYKCVECDEWFDTFDDLKSHQIKDHNNDDIDPFISKKKEGIEIPLSTLPKYFCTICSFETFTTNEMKVHRQDHEDDDKIIRYIVLSPHADPKLVEEPTYECSECDVMPDTLKVMDEHWKATHVNRALKLSRIYGNTMEEKFSCDDCQNKFAFENLLKLHTKVKHN